ncbi:MAG: hypothetical protein ACRC30_11250 [Clostridium sp.]
MTKTFVADEFCDFLDPNKICDNCGACLNLSKADLHAIRIEEISKNIEENSIVESDLDNLMFNENENDLDWTELMNKAKKIDPTLNRDEIEKLLFIENNNLKEELENLDFEFELEEKESFEEEIIYLEDLNLEESELEEETIEIFPGLRRLKSKK